MLSQELWFSEHPNGKTSDRMVIARTVDLLHIQLDLIDCYADWQWTQWKTDDYVAFYRHYEIIEATVTIPCIIMERAAGLYNI